MFRRLPTSLVVLILASLCLVAAMAPAAVDAKVHPQWRGFDAGNAWDTQPESRSRKDVREAAALGADTIRIVLRWDWLAPVSRGEYPPARVKRITRLLKAARSEHLRVVATVSSTPSWASGQTDVLGAYNRAQPPRHATDYGDFMGFLARRWGRLITALEVWNEPNQRLFWRGSPSAYVALVRAARKAVDDSRNRDVSVVAGALAGSDTQYLQGLYDRGVDKWSDAISVHPYDLDLARGFRDPSVPRPGDIGSFASGVPAIHQTMRSNGDRSPLLITEFGVADCYSAPYCVTPELQARYLEAAARLAARWSYLHAFLVYRLRDASGAGLLIENRFGVLAHDWSPKPAAEAMSSTFEALPSVPLSVRR